MTKSRFFLFLLLSFIAGVALRSFWIVPMVFLWAGVIVGFVIGSLGLIRKFKKIAVYGFLILAFLVGVFRFEGMERTKPDLSLLYQRPLILRGIIWEEPNISSNIQRAKVKIFTADGRELQDTFFTQITLRRHPEFRIGDEIIMQGLLERVQNFREFDYISYLARENIYSSMSFPLIDKIGEGEGSKLKLALSQIKSSFEEKIDRALPEPHGAFLKGLILGERDSLPKDLVENFKKTGTTHIVALSGYNITIIGRFFVTVLLFLTTPFYLSFWLATAGITLFVILTGASASVVRAGIMGVLVLLARREGRAYHMTNALFLAAAVMIFENPKILRFDAAFELSFLATMGLMYLSPHIERYLDGAIYYWRRKFNVGGEVDSRFIKKIAQKDKLFSPKQIFIETLSAQLAVLPLLIYLFGRVSVISPPANLFILMAVPFSMTMGFITGALGFLWEPLSLMSGWISWVLLEYKIKVIELLAAVPWAFLDLAWWSIVPISVFYTIWFYYLWKRSKRI